MNKTESNWQECDVESEDVEITGNDIARLPDDLKFKFQYAAARTEDVTNDTRELAQALRDLFNAVGNIKEVRKAFEGVEGIVRNYELED